MVLLTLVAAPAVELFTLDELKDHLRIDASQTEDDAYLMRLVAAVRQHLDGYSGYLGRALITQTWRLDLERFSSVERIPLPRLQSVTSITYIDSNGDTQTVSSSVYEVISDGDWDGYVRKLTSQSWPTDVSTEYAYPVSITFKAGFGDSWNDVPEDIRLAALMLIAETYMSRGEFIPDNLVKNPNARLLLAKWRAVNMV